jgi:hypothetical protein
MNELSSKSSGNFTTNYQKRKPLLSHHNREDYILEKVRLVSELVSFITAYIRRHPANPEHKIATDDKIWLEDVLWTSANGKGMTVDEDGFIDGKVCWMFGLELQKQDGDVIQFLHNLLLP